MGKKNKKRVNNNQNINNNSDIKSNVNTEISDSEIELENKSALEKKLDSGYEKFLKIFYRFFPLVFTEIALVLSFIRIDIQKSVTESGVEFKSKMRFVNSNVIAGDPNVIAILAVISMILCMIVVPKTMVKKHKSGDGLGIMFMPLGLLCLFEVMTTIENKRLLPVGIVFGIVLFVISALGTFKKTINIVYPLCVVMVFVASYFMLADLTPYCYNKYFTTGYINNNDYIEEITRSWYLLSYYLRDIALIFAYGVFSAKVSMIYKNMKQ